MGKKRSETNKASSVMSIDLLNTLADDFLTEAWKLEPLTEEYQALNESQKKKFDTALDRLFGWLDQMKPEGIINFWTEYDAMLKKELESSERRDPLEIARRLWIKYRN